MLSKAFEYHSTLKTFSKARTPINPVFRSNSSTIFPPSSMLKTVNQYDTVVSAVPYDFMMTVDDACNTLETESNNNSRTTHFCVPNFKIR